VSSYLWAERTGHVLLPSGPAAAVCDTHAVLQAIRSDLHGEQLTFVDDQSTRILGATAGYGAGKTWSLCAKAVSLAIANPGITGCVLEPTGPLIRDIWQPDFEAFLETYEIPYTARQSPLPEYLLHLPDGDTKVLCRSFENWRRIIGLNLAWVLSDEIDTIDPKIANLAFPKILGRLRAGKVRQFASVSTPEGFRWMYQTFQSDDGQKRADRRLVKMRTRDNPHLPDDYIETLEANYDPQLLRAYLEGEFVNLTSGQVYDRFNRVIHVKPCHLAVDEDDGILDTIYVGLDFNIGNTNAVCAVRTQSGGLHVFAEIKTHDTEAMGQELRRRFGDAKILGYPDASGGNRSTNSSRSDIAILESYAIRNQAPAKNPPIRDRVAAVQALLENGKGQHRLHVDPACTGLIGDLEQQSYDDRGEPDKGHGNDHRPDALGYVVHRLYAVERQTSHRAVRGIRVY
jgi:hypothetical protein